MISVRLKAPSEATLVIYNQKGQKVRTLHKGLIDKGSHDFIWNAKDDNNKPVKSKVYLYKLISNKTELTRKMILLK